MSILHWSRRLVPGKKATSSPRRSRARLQIETLEDRTLLSLTAVATTPTATGIATNTPVSVTLNEPIQESTLSFVLKDAGNNAVPAIVTYNPATEVATLTPNFALLPSITYTATVSGATDLSGTDTISPVSWSFTTSASLTGATLFGNAATPTVAAWNDPSADELGVKFQADVNGSITGVRFYKGIGNSGTHVAHLWTTDGTLLATATFTNESDSGWQQVNFDIPVAINAHTTYIASYFAPQGFYAADGGFFLSTSVDSGRLHALSSVDANGNGVYIYGPNGGFPNQTFNATNYWVDVLFNAPPDTTPPTILGQTPANGTTSVSTTPSITVTFSESVRPSSIALGLKDSNDNPVAATVTYNDAKHIATLQPTSPLAQGATYTVTESGATDLVGNSMTGSVSWSFTTQTGPSYTIWSPPATPAVAAWDDPQADELGVKFESDVDGFITGLRFYKGSGNGGTHVGHLWALDGTLLAAATFTNESASGWQQVTFGNPVAITANTIYVASYFAPQGHYAADSAYFATAGVNNAPLHALAGGNGVYSYGSSGGFPNLTYNATNYWVDVVFTQAPAIPPPTVNQPTINVTANGGTYNRSSFGVTSATVTGAGSNGILASLTVDSATLSFTYSAVGPNNSLSQLSGAPVSAGSYQVVAHYTSDKPNYNSVDSAAVAFTISPAPLTVSAVGINRVYNGTTTATVTLSDNHLGNDNVVDSYTSANFADPFVGTGKTVTVTGIHISGLDAGNYALQNTTAITTANITLPGDSVYVLNSTASGALSLSGNATINVPGQVVVDSKSSSALSESGNARITASTIQVVGGTSATGNAGFSIRPVTGAAALADPFAGLAVPTGGVSQGSVNLSGNGSLTINPGVYSQIQVSGNAKLTLNPGIYVIAGGGFTVSGNASVTGSGILIYNAGSNGTFGGLTLSGNGNINLAPANTGPYAGILVFQSRDNARAMSLSGNALMLNGGTIYAPAALLSVSGNAQIKGTVVVDRLQLSGNAGSTLEAAGGTSDGSNSSNTAGTLLAGAVTLYVDNTAGNFSADELARLDDAVAAINAVVAPFGTTITFVDDANSASTILTMATTSACGGAADGVLGCEMPGSITLVLGWNWYSGANPATVGADQFDFETIVMHELGHSLGLGHSSDAVSVMYATLGTGTARRELSIADLNIADSDAGADGLHAALPSVGKAISTEAASASPSTVVRSEAVSSPNTLTVPPGPGGVANGTTVATGLVLFSTQDLIYAATNSASNRFASVAPRTTGGNISQLNSAGSFVSMPPIPSLSNGNDLLVVGLGSALPDSSFRVGLPAAETEATPDSNLPLIFSEGETSGGVLNHTALSGEPTGAAAIDQFFSTLVDGTAAEMGEDAARILTTALAHEEGNEAGKEDLALADLVVAGAVMWAVFGASGNISSEESAFRNDRQGSQE